MIKLPSSTITRSSRSGFAQLLNLEPDLRVVAEFGSRRKPSPVARQRRAAVRVRHLHAGSIRAGLLRQLPAGLAVVMLSVHDSPASSSRPCRPAPRFFSPSAAARTN